MKLLIQRVVRATVEVDGCVENRIGSGLVLSLAVRKGDKIEKAKSLAAQVVKLLIWPEMFDSEKQWCASVKDNGFEILAICQQSLYASFPELAPSEQGLDNDEAATVFEVFVEALKAEYQEEMVVTAPIGQQARVEIVSDGPCVFELNSEGQGVGPASAPPAKVGGQEGNTPTVPLEPDVASVTAALQRLPGLSKNRGTLETSRIFRVFGMKKFRAALSDAAQSEADLFAEALDAAAHFFSVKQQESITAWTGLSISATPGEEAADEEELERQLADLKSQVAGGGKGKGKKKNGPAMVKAEFFEDTASRQGATAGRMQTQRTTCPDWQGRPAPNTPAAVAARQWAASRYSAGDAQGGRQQVQSYQRSGKPTTQAKGSGKGMGTKGWRSQGIASLDESSRLHGTPGDYAWGQTAVLPDSTQGVQLTNHEVNDEDGAQAEAGEWEAAGRSYKRHGGPGDGGALKRPKGRPTVAPLCPPGPTDMDEEL